MLLFLMLIFWICGGAGQASWADEPPELEIGKDVPEFDFSIFDREKSGVEYKAEIVGVQDDAVLEQMKSASDVFFLLDSPPASMNLLRIRVRDDIPEMKKALGYHGFFKAVIEARIDEDKKTPLVVFQVDPGPRFILEKVEILETKRSAAAGIDLPKPGEVGLLVGHGYYGEDVVKADEKILADLGRKGYPFPKVTGRKVIADHLENTVAITFTVERGALAVFGPLTIEGLNDIKAGYVLDLIPWREGDRFDSSAVKGARATLIESGLFSSAEITPGQLGADNVLPVTLKFKERPFRTMSAGVDYQTDLGPGGKLGWEHRNFFGAGERLEVALAVNQIEQTLGGSFRKPFFLEKSQALIIKSGITDESSEAYESRSFEVLGALERSLSRKSLFGLGARYRFITEDEKTKRFGLVNALFNGESLILNQDSTYGLVSFPLYFKFDGSDNLLDPSTGGRLGLHWEPFTDIFQNSKGFWKLLTSYSHYFEVIGERRLVLAGKVVWGVVGSETRNDVPKDELMYSGGGGSVRGYAYQYAGDLGIDKEPMGGLSKLEMSMEARTKLTKSLGLAAFLDGGRAYADEIKDPAHELFWGLGGGVRYYSPIGPFRADIAFPLNKRRGVDSDFQIYVSLGQSF
ncbi:MAG: BamA/TamA family outer membrane protein [Pseudomonadota bacterium]